MDKLASQTKEKLEWRKSIVDLMKLLNLDSSVAARKKLAKELHYAGNMRDSASMNVWLHKQVMIKLAEHGGEVPELHTAQTAMTDQEAKAWVGRASIAATATNSGRSRQSCERLTIRSPNYAPISAACWASASMKSLFRRVGSTCRMTVLCLS